MSDDSDSDSSFSEDEHYHFGRGVNMDRTGLNRILRDHVTGANFICPSARSYRIRSNAEIRPPMQVEMVPHFHSLKKNEIRDEKRPPIEYHIDSVFRECEGVVGRRFNSCLMGALSCSRYTNPEEAVLEHGRSILFFTVFLYSLSTRDLIICCLLLKAVEKLDLQNKFKDFSYVHTIINAEFNLPESLLRNAKEFTDTLNRSGFMTVPDYLIKLIDFLSQGSQETSVA